jgi:inhibitor of cysteine peptidase
MQHRSLFRFASALLAVLVAAVAPALAQSSAPSPLIVTEKDDGKTLQLTVGHELVIQLPSNPSIGYTWVLPWDLGPLVGGRQKHDADGGNVPGAGGTDTFKFYAKDTGTVTLTLDYKVPWQNDPPTRTFSVTVNVVPCAGKCNCD